MRIVGIGLTGNDDVLALVGPLDPGANVTIRSYSTLEAKAVSEVASDNSDTADLLYLQVRDRVSCAFVTNDLVRWTTTDIGHSTVPHAASPACSCGSISCFQSVANASILPESEKDKHAVILRRIGKNLGSAVTALISLLLPDRLVIDSPWNGSEHLLAGLREWVYGRVSPAAAQKITISYPAPFRGEVCDAAARCLINEILSRETIDGM
jgi:predicted NBD/HSP70 family sugar kinase